MVVGEIAHEKELVIIGGGPGGYHAAIRASQLGIRAVLIEKKELGGICLNKGCIPSKVFSHTGELLTSIKTKEQFGIKAEKIEFDFHSLIHYKQEAVQRLRSGVDALCRENKVEIIKGKGYFLSEDRIGVEQKDSYEVFRFKSAVIASGGVPVEPSGCPINDSRVLSPWTITNLKTVPGHLIILGGDYIALEMAMAYKAFGSKVSMVLPEGKRDFSFDPAINRELTRVFKKTGISILKGYSMLGMDAGSETITIQLKGENESKNAEGTHLFYSLGTRPNVKNLGLERLGLALTEEGCIQTDPAGRTSIRNIYAVGDAVSGPSLAVKAMKQGKIAAETIAGLKSETDLRFMPRIARTYPPIACAGLTEPEAIAEGYDAAAGEFSLAGNGYAEILGSKEGLAKLVFDKKTDVLLGVHLIGRGAAELLSGGIQALEMAARFEDLRFPLYPHPSLNEAVMEAAEAFKGESIHSRPKKLKRL
ncbi:dihydrolipoyl dehydrogenase [Peribacillus kribbensis]|uniref:dihydrolipoyl dehydrogenase n=1 Tax=Peribacillus kribbensis TaxID=356658 RepID=UPI000423658C|nr:dihydrolipoyl dehydrogenase [Peribacillus kribbensis]